MDVQCPLIHVQQAFMAGNRPFMEVLRVWGARRAREGLAELGEVDLRAVVQHCVQAF